LYENIRYNTFVNDVKTLQNSPRKCVLSSLLFIWDLFDRGERYKCFFWVSEGYSDVVIRGERVVRLRMEILMVERDICGVA